MSRICIRAGHRVRTTNGNAHFVMNLKLLRGCLLEELGRVHHSTLALRELRPEIERATGRPGALEFLAHCEARQTEKCRAAFERFEAPLPEKPGPALSGLLAEIREDLIRQSGMYPPAAADFRLLAGLNRILHYKMAALQSALLAADSMASREIADEFTRCLDEDVRNSRHLTGLAKDALCLCGAESSEEIAAAMAGSDQEQTKWSALNPRSELHPIAPDWERSKFPAST